MKKLLFLFVCSATLLVGCSMFKDNVVKPEEIKQIHTSPIREFTELPKSLLDDLDNMGVDNLPVLNEYEGRFFNTIFKISPQEFDLAGKRVGFTRNKMDYFSETRKRYEQNETPVGGCCLYVFDSAQKEECGGYDAAIVYWSKYVIPTEKVIKKLKAK